MEMNDKLTIDEAGSSALEDIAKESTVDTPSGQIVSFVQERFNRASDARQGEETRWLQAYRNYRGIYGPDVQFTEAEKSRVFIKVTKTKVLAAYGQITEVLFGNNRFPISINPTTLPEGVAETVFLETNPQTSAMAQGAAQGAPQAPQAELPKLLPGETLTDLKERLGGLKKTLEPVADKIKEGSGSGPTEVAFHPALVSAKKMEKQIHDQLEESNSKKHLRASAFECALFGTGVMKGPFAVDKEYPNWDEDGTYTPTIKTLPQTSHVSIWNFYPDPDAVTVEDCEYMVERHKMSRSQLRALKRRPYFRSNAIDLAITQGEDYILELWESHMDDHNDNPRTERFEVL